MNDDRILPDWNVKSSSAALSSGLRSDRILPDWNVKEYADMALACLELIEYYQIGLEI